MMTSGSSAQGSFIRATSVRGLTLNHGKTIVGTVTGLIYDHRNKQVTHLKLVTRLNGELVAASLSEVEFHTLNHHTLQVKRAPSWTKLPDDHAPVDRLTVVSPSRVTTVFVHDVWFTPQTGRIDRYELGLLPRKASSMPSLCLKAAQVTYENGQLFADDDVLKALSATFNLCFGLSRPLARWSTAYSDHSA